MSQSCLIKELPVSERPRERLLAEGPDALSSTELVAILLRTGTKGISALEVARNLVTRYKSLNDLCRVSANELCLEKGIGPDKAVTLVAAFKLARLMAAETATGTPTLDTPERVADFIREEFRQSEVEQFKVVLLNTRRKPIRFENVSDGTLDSIMVHPRNVFKPAIIGNAAAIVLVHNHPSGDPSPSEADIKVTRDLIRAGQLLKIDVLDHIILGKKTADREKDFISLRELGYFAT